MESTAGQYLEMHSAQIAVGAGIFGVSLALSIAAAIFVILRLPEDYFHSEQYRVFWPGRPFWLRVLGVGLKNLIGLGLVVLGIAMSVPGVPGQGLLTIFIGIVLLDFPGKRKLERRIIATAAIFAACNRVRVRFGKPPLLPIEHDDSETEAKRKSSPGALTK